MAGLIFEDAEKAKEAIMATQQEEISKLYAQWSHELAKKAQELSHKTTYSAQLQTQQLNQLKNAMIKQSDYVYDQMLGMIKDNMYMMSDSVVQANTEWLKSLGFSQSGINAAFNHVPSMAVNNLITGQVYQGGWNLSQAIWSDKHETLKDISLQVTLNV